LRKSYLLTAVHSRALGTSVTLRFRSPLLDLEFAILFGAALTTGCLGDLASAQGPGPEDCKVLFIGNSLTYFNAQPSIVEQMATAAGKNVYIDQAMIGGATLEDHARSSQTLGKIREQPWDFVVLQQAIMAVAFPDMHESIIGPIMTLKDAVLGVNGDARIVYFMDYSMKDGLYWLGQYYSYSASQQMLYDGTLALAETLDMSVAPIGWAWNTVMRDSPQLDLYAEDNAHPSYLGSYLGAAVYFSTIFQEMVSGATHSGIATSEDASYLQTVGSRMVLDSLNLWRLPSLEGPCGAQ